MSARAVLEHYDPDTRWGRAFGVVDRRHYSPPLYQHRGQDIRKLSSDETYSVVTDVVALDGGVVSHTFEKSSTGREIVVDTGRKRGRYEIHCHVVNGVPRGTRVDAGGFLARNANAKQQPGTGWTAPHDHVVISDYPDAAHTPSRPVYDPRPFIRTALAAASIADAKPASANPGVPIVVTPADTEEDFIMAAGVIYTDDSRDKDRRGAVLDTTSGLFSTFGHFAATYADDLARSLGGVKAGKVTAGHYDKLASDMAALRAARKA